MMLLLSASALLLALVGWLVLRVQKRKQQDQVEKEPSDVETSYLSSALILELAAAMLRAGQNLAAVTYELAQVSESAREQDSLLEVSRGLSHGLSWETAWVRAERLLKEDVPATLRGLRDCLQDLADTGSPTADLLNIVAERQRRFDQRQAEKQAAQLAVKLVVPLGLCSLPAFICWGIIPVMIALIPGLAGTF